jgi:thymidylate synthase
MNTLNYEWHRTYCAVMERGRVAAPRGAKIRELDHHAIAVDMRYPVLTIPERKLSYRFMAAEALWMIQGRSDVFHRNMAPFSDDGFSLSGAYGPRIHDQIYYVIGKLLEDRDTRQAALSIWAPNPRPSRDVPCTMSMAFSIRDDRLNLHVFMRSSDVWLGLPYDAFSFAMVANWVALLYNGSLRFPCRPVAPGALYITAASSHLYEKDWGCEIASRGATPAVPTFGSLSELTDALTRLSMSKRGDALRWWEV